MTYLKNPYINEIAYKENLPDISPIEFKSTKASSILFISMILILVSKVQYYIQFFNTIYMYKV